MRVELRTPASKMRVPVSASDLSAQGYEAREHQPVPGIVLRLGHFWCCDGALQQGQPGGSAQQRERATRLDVQVVPVDGSDSGKTGQSPERFA